MSQYYCTEIDLLCAFHMEEKGNRLDPHKYGKRTTANGVTNLMNKPIHENLFIWQDTITEIDLSGRNIDKLDDHVKLPANLLQLNLSHNRLSEVPCTILKLDKLIVLNLSHNAIIHFDESPEFCHTLQLLDLSYNKLAGPPYWIWTECPKNLARLNLNYNISLTMSFIDGNFEELLQYNTLVIDINIQNCKLGKYKELLGTLSKAQSLLIGAKDYTPHANSLIEIPCEGLDKCCELKSLKVCNTHIYNINPSIEMYQNLIEIDMAQNNLSELPNEFCNLGNLEICVLSNNKILYLPDDMHKMQKLKHLYLDSNELCMLPETFYEMITLKILDLYNNYLHEVPELDNLDEFDIAQNYCDEPDNDAYLEKKDKLRLLHENRYNGRKDNKTQDDEYSEARSTDEEDDDELFEIIHNGKKIDSPLNMHPPSSPEDWDSDEYWVPCHTAVLPKVSSPWLYHVKQKMREGNFCPMDAHPVPIAEKVKYERQSNPHVCYESDGQFDDYSSDNT